MRRVTGRIFAALGMAAGLSAQPASLRAQCQLCGGDVSAATASGRADTPETPISIEVDTGIDFSRLAMASNAGGTVELDPMSGQRQISGALIDLGGMAFGGQVRISGSPGRLVTITIPERVMLASSDGSTAEIMSIRTTLPSLPRLGPDGRLSFAFGGRLVIKGRVSGDLRGRIPISADYQ